ncbi:hypothetical protein [Geomicrobium sediminis]|uniref:Uncharacterized protein n=1 Tax=Geomicrobium sediminis TaxID=1347788 RepID=A0ABS2P7J9_9BACL|nr:hypothetical protein [Geomicrobium sediminis]MBM7631096.1 hypothetical protein [Geomicrobium sediminis]
MDVFLSVNNRERVIQLPVVPEGFKIDSPHNNETYNSFKWGDIKLIGTTGLKGFTLSSFFPIKDYPFLRSRDYFGWEYIEEIEEWKNRRVPIRVIVTGTPINWPMSIENFTYGPENGSGDLYYDLQLDYFPWLTRLERS